MIPYQLSAVVTQPYFQDGDEAVREILVFLGTESFNKFESAEKGDPKLATFRVRSVKTGESDYVGKVRLGSGEMILETTSRNKSQNSMLYDTLNRLLPGWELKEIYSDKVPSVNPFDGKF